MATSGTFYVYEHWRLDRDECFYVGKGRGYRAYSSKSRNQYHKAIVAKLRRIGSAMEVRIVACGLSEEEAFEIEKARIKFWKDAGVELANATNGGEGVSGLKMSASTREKMRLAKIGKKQTPEQIEKRIAPLRGRQVDRDAILRGAAKRKGRKLSEEHKKKISLAHTGKIVSETARASLRKANKGKPWSAKRWKAHWNSMKEKSQ